MVTRYPQQRCRYARHTLAYLLIVYGMVPVSNADGITTLFTTPQERRLINDNRYLSDAVVNSAQQAEISRSDEIRDLVRGEIKQSLTISGITVSNDGNHSVWINNQSYQDGETMEGKIRLKVLTGKNIRVRITTPDGTHYYGTSGETIEVSFLEGSDPES